MRLIQSILFIGTPLICGGAQAQEPYPNQPIRFIVPFTPGSSSDVTARAIAQKISGPLGQPVTVDNRPGANGGIGMQAVARSKPDGYTLVVGTVSSTVVPHIISKNVPFDLFKDFVPVATMANTPLLMTVTYDSSIKNVADLVAAARKAPRTMTYGNSAGLYRIAMEAVNYHAGIDMLGVPFKGPAQAATELLAEETPDRQSRCLGCRYTHAGSQAHARLLFWVPAARRHCPACPPCRSLDTRISPSMAGLAFWRRREPLNP